MLADAVAAELYKVLRQRGGLFWGFCAVPLGYLAFNLVFDTWVRSRVALPGAIDLNRIVLDGLGMGGSAFFQIFFAAGAVSIFSAEYRFETWRLLTPRNSRANLLLAKFAVYAALAAVSLLALGVFSALHAFYAAALGGSLVLPGAVFPVQAAGVFLVSWSELLLLGLFAAVIATASRAMIGPLIATITFAFAQQMGMMVLGPATAKLHWLAVFPGMAAYYLRAWVAGAPIGDALPELPRALVCALVLPVWVALLGGAALARFQRQDLTRE